MVVLTAMTGEVSVMVDPNSFKNVVPDGVTIDPDATPEQAGGLLPIKRKFNSVGSGFVADAAAGYIITNAHVVKDGKTITYRLTDDGRATLQVAKERFCKTFVGVID